MPPLFRRFPLVVLTCLLLAASTSGAVVVENSRYRVVLQDDASVVFTDKVSGASVPIRPRIAVKFSPAEVAAPGLSRIEERWFNGDRLNYLVDTWEGETDFFRAPGENFLREGVLSISGLDGVSWNFADDGIFSGRLTIIFQGVGGPPSLIMDLETSQAGTYSFAFAGMAEAPREEVDWVWQPLVWTGNRFPERSYLTREFQATIPAVMYSRDGVTAGVAAAHEMPFRLPVRGNSRFGMVLRSEEGTARPMIFHPVYGDETSRLDPGEKLTFSVHPIVNRSSWFENHRDLAASLYRFGDHRENSISTMNETIDNMVDYIMTEEYSYWLDNFKTWAYYNDLPGYGRQQTALGTLSLALVTDSPDVYHRRALPTMEYMLSRRNQYFNVGEHEVGRDMGATESWSWDLSTEYAGLHAMSGGTTPVFDQRLRAANSNLLQAAPDRPVVDLLAASRNVQQYLHRLLAMYRHTGRVEYLRRAVLIGEDYLRLRVEPPVEDFRDVRSSFWSELQVRWDALLELHRATGDGRFLEGGRRGLEELTGSVYLGPPILLRNVTVNHGGEVRGIPAPEESVPGWRVSSVGLWPEAAGTAHNHRGIFMTPYAGYLMRAASDHDEGFFRDIARSAVVGRYANYPSYAYRHFHTTVFEKPDYPLRSFEEMTYTSVHYNHPVPQVLFLLDYLIAEAGHRSGGRIHFPSHFTDTSAYFKFPVYGDRPGRVHDIEGVWPWMPKGLLSVDHRQVNYLAGRTDGAVVLILMNASAAPIDFTATINPDHVELAPGPSARVYQHDGAVGGLSMDGNGFSLSLPAKGLATVAIEGATALRGLPTMAFEDPPARTISPCAGFEEPTDHAGTIRGTVLSFAEELTTLLVWSDAPPSMVGTLEVTMEWDGGSMTERKDVYPFEVTLPVEPAIDEIVLHIGGMLASGAPFLLEPKPLVIRAPRGVTTLHVDPDWVPGNGESWEAPFVSLADALAAAGAILEEAGECAPGVEVEIRIAGGIYTIDAALELPGGIHLSGGHLPGEGRTRGRSTIRQTASGSPVIRITGDGPPRPTDLRGLFLTGADAAPMGGGILIEDPGLGVAISDSRIDGNRTAGDGGGIALLAPGSGPGVLRLDSVEIVDNVALGEGARGGGIHLAPGCAIEVHGSLFRGNRTEGEDGGALHIEGGGDRSRIDKSIFSGNSASLRGGAIHASHDLDIGDTLFLGNSVTAAETAWVHGGGALYLAGSDPRMDVRRSRFIANAARGANGGGGAVLVAAGELDLRSCLFVANEVPSGSTSRGGAINVEGGGLRSINCTFAHNINPSPPRGAAIMTKVPGTVVINSLFANNAGIALATIQNGSYTTQANHHFANTGATGDNGDPLFRHTLPGHPGGVFLPAAGNSLDGETEGAPVRVGDALLFPSLGGRILAVAEADGAAVRLAGALGEGGLEATDPLPFVLLAFRPYWTSPVVDAGLEGWAPDFDVEGRPRPSGRGIDIGAFEAGEVPSLWLAE